MVRTARAGLDITPDALEVLRLPVVELRRNTIDLLASASMAQAFDMDTPPATAGDVVANAAGQWSVDRVESAGDDSDELSDRHDEADDDAQAELDRMGIMGALIAHGLGELPLHELAERCRVADVGPGLIGRIAMNHRARDGGCDAQAIVDSIEAACDTRTQAGPAGTAKAHAGHVR